MMLVGMVLSGIGWGAIIIMFRQFHRVARYRGFPNDMHTEAMVAGLYNSFNNFGYVNVVVMVFMTFMFNFLY